MKLPYHHFSRRKNLRPLYLVVFLSSCFLFPAAQNVITIKTDSSKTIINKNIYGHFSEHLGHCIYGGFYVGDTSKQITKYRRHSQ